ncbi:MAG: hypothetical protein ACK4F9_01575 [Brevinematia bacterium]
MRFVDGACGVRYVYGSIREGIKDVELVILYLRILVYGIGRLRD